MHQEDMLICVCGEKRLEDIGQCRQAKSSALLTPPEWGSMVCFKANIYKKPPNWRLKR